ncbi:hypothetical protein GPALN_007753 [Globodera pallida]|nr:hypothetical protein GPALN_007753 [Globodera pallida]
MPKRKRSHSNSNRGRNQPNVQVQTYPAFFDDADFDADDNDNTLAEQQESVQPHPAWLDEPDEAFALDDEDVESNVQPQMTYPAFFDDADFNDDDDNTLAEQQEIVQPQETYPSFLDADFNDDDDNTRAEKQEIVKPQVAASLHATDEAFGVKHEVRANAHHSNRGTGQQKHVSFGANHALTTSSGTTSALATPTLDECLHETSRRFTQMSANSVAHMPLEAPSRPVVTPFEDIINTPAPIGLPTQHLAVRAGEMPIAAITIDPPTDARAPPKMNIYASVTELELAFRHRVTRADGSTTTGADYVMAGLGLTAHLNRQREPHAAVIPTAGIVTQLQQLIEQVTEQLASQAQSVALAHAMRAPGRVQPEDPLAVAVRQMNETVTTLVKNENTKFSS